MARYDEVIAFLEDEAHALRTRIADLGDRDYPPGVTTGEGDPPDWVLSREDAQLKLARIEQHLRTLRGG